MKSSHGSFCTYLAFVILEPFLFLGVISIFCEQFLCMALLDYLPTNSAEMSVLMTFKNKNLNRWNLNFEL